jgi:hypothetical protein
MSLVAIDFSRALVHGVLGHRDGPRMGLRCCQVILGPWARKTIGQLVSPNSPVVNHKCDFTTPWKLAKY